MLFQRVFDEFTDNGKVYEKIVILRVLDGYYEMIRTGGSIVGANRDDMCDS